MFGMIWTALRSFFGLKKKKPILTSGPPGEFSYSLKQVEDNRKVAAGFTQSNKVRMMVPDYYTKV